MASSAALKEVRTLQSRYPNVALDPKWVVQWASMNKGSALYKEFDWNNDKAAVKWRLHQAAQLLATVRVRYEKRKVTRVTVVPIEGRRKKRTIKVTSLETTRRQSISDALNEYKLLGKKYSYIKELDVIRAVVDAVADKEEARKEFLKRAISGQSRRSDPRYGRAKSG